MLLPLRPQPPIYRSLRRYTPALGWSVTIERSRPLVVAGHRRIERRCHSSVYVRHDHTEHARDRDREILDGNPRDAPRLHTRPDQEEQAIVFGVIAGAMIRKDEPLGN